MVLKKKSCQRQLFFFISKYLDMHHMRPQKINSILLLFKVFNDTSDGTSDYERGGEIRLDLSSTIYEAFKEKGR